MKRYYSPAIAGILVLQISVGAYGQSNANGLPFRQENLVRLHTRAVGARAVGVFAVCDDKIAPEECAFTVESVRYTATGSSAAATKFDAVCIDIGFPDVAAAGGAWNCSPVTGDGLAVSVDAAAGGAIQANGGVSTGSTSGVGSNGQVTLGFGVALPITSRLQYPMAQHASSGGSAVRLGGNILTESRIGAVSAGQSVVFGHTSFEGGVTFMVTRPASMTLTVGHVNTGGETQCNRPDGSAVACPVAMERALRSACELSAGRACTGGAGDGPGPTTAFGQAIDVDELRASLVKHQDTMATVNADLKEKLADKITEVFELLDSDEETEGNTAALPRLRIFAKVKTLIQTKLLPKLEEIKELVQKQVSCPS